MVSVDVKHHVYLLTIAIWQQSRTYHLPTYFQLLNKSYTKKQKAKNLAVFWGEKSQEMDHYHKNDQTERARGLGRKNKRGDRKME